MSDNPNAFPFAAEYGHPAACGGMTLRDWFAGQNFAAAIASATNLGEVTQKQRKDAFSMVAKISYEAADAMLAARMGDTDNG